MTSPMHNSDSKLKILFVSSDKYPPFRPAARALFLEELPKLGYCIDWLVQSQDDCEKSYRIENGDGCIHVGATDLGGSRWRRLRKHLLDLANDCRMLSLVRKNRYDVIQVKDKYLSAILAILVARLYRVKFIYWIAFPHPEASIYEAKQGTARYRTIYLFRGYILKFILYRLIFPLCDHAFVQSEQMKCDIAEVGVPEQKMTPIPGSVNLDNIPYVKQDTRNIDSTTSQEVSIVYLGTLIRMRKLEFVLKVFQIVLQQFPEAKLYLIGKGDVEGDEKFLKDEVARLKLQKAVVFTGFLSMQAAWEYIRTARVCLSPYYPMPLLNSTSPTKLIEYMAMARPVIGNDHPEQKLVIEESKAGLCTPWEEKAFADAIVSILNNPADAEVMGRWGRLYVEKNRTNTVMANLVDKTYRYICNGGQAEE